MARSLVADFSHWLREALPFWATAGVDRERGGFVEALTFDGADAAIDFKRVRVACRQIYVFAHAHHLGWMDDAAPLIAEGAAHLTDKAWRRPDGGFARLLTRSGDVLDQTPDLYDNAFALFAFAWAHRATGDAAYRAEAAKTLDWIQSNLRHPNGEGFLNAAPARGLRLQNPHMHLLEACLAGFDATGEDRYKAQALEIVRLFETHFFRADAGAHFERFEEDWSLAPGPEARALEPGHQLEWAWILQQCGRAFGVEADGLINQLCVWSERHGVNSATGGVMNSVDANGAPIDAGSRTWPNTERLKAAVARARIGGPDPDAVLESTGRLLLSRYLSSNNGIEIPRGAWIDAFDADGRATAKNVPASTFYHLFLAFAEVIDFDASRGDTGAG